MCLGSVYIVLMSEHFELTEQDVLELEALAKLLKAEANAGRAEQMHSPSGFGDKVTGIRVVRNGITIQEWHDE